MMITASVPKQNMCASDLCPYQSHAAQKLAQIPSFIYLLICYRGRGNGVTSSQLCLPMLSSKNLIPKSQMRPAMAERPRRASARSCSPAPCVKEGHRCDLSAKCCPHKSAVKQLLLVAFTLMGGLGRLSEKVCIFSPCSNQIWIGKPRASSIHPI